MLDAKTPTACGVEVPQPGSCTGWTRCRGFGHERMTGAPVGTQHLQTGQHLRLKTHERAAVRGRPQVGDSEKPALPAIGRTFRPRRRAGGRRCVRWHGRTMGKGWWRTADPARWPCPAPYERWLRVGAGGGSGCKGSACRHRVRAWRSSCLAWSKRCAMQLDSPP